MRVIAGSARGTKLICPVGLSVRPTHDRVKEALFSMITERLPEAAVLDLFAGTGALGIEALSRGAASAVFVDVSTESLKTVENNLIKTHLLGCARLIREDYLSFLSACTNRFDLIFLDPPYSMGYLLDALSAIRHRKLLKDEGIVFCEMDSQLQPELFDGYEILRNKKYGRAQVLLLKELAI